MSDVRFMGFKKHPNLKFLPSDCVYPNGKGLMCEVRERYLSFKFLLDCGIHGKQISYQSLECKEVKNPVFRVPARTERW